MTQTIWIARHGNRIDFVNPEWFNTAERRFDPHLSDDGVVQAYQLGQRLKRENITHIFASPFLRTVQTANQIAEALDLPIKLESGLSEWLNPAWMPAMPETMSIEALTEVFPRIDTSYTSRVIAEYPETDEKSLERSGKTARLLADEFLPEDILLVGHGASVLGATMGLVGETAKTQVNASLCCLVKVVRQDIDVDLVTALASHTSPKWVLELNGDTSHLTEIEEVIRFN
jgi:broad specificity phosphatase PhoE